VLTAAQIEAQQQAPARPKRSAASLRQQHREYLMQRIEDYKESLSREELLRLGDEAARELHHGGTGQLVLTEVLMQETVDQQIARRLNLPSFRKWRSRILPLREAQRDPTHWQMAQGDPVVTVLPRLEPGDRALVVGSGADRAVFLLAAHDAEVTCLFEHTSAADRVEGILATESLGGRCHTYVGLLGGAWTPPVLLPFHLAVVDARTVLALEPDRQQALFEWLQRHTAPEGLHALVASDPGVAPEACLRHYPDWQRLPLPVTGGQPGPRGVLLAGPPARSLATARVRSAV
jgi:hypothetical protein